MTGKTGKSAKTNIQKKMRGKSRKNVIAKKPKKQRQNISRKDITISNVAIRKIAHSCNIRRIENTVFMDIRNRALSFVKNIINDMVMFAERDCRKTIMYRHVVPALANLKFQPTIQLVHDADELKILRKSLYIPAQTFHRFVKKCVETASTHQKLHIAKNIYIILQFCVEHYMSNIFDCATYILKHMNKHTITVEDIELIFSLNSMLKL